MNKPQLLVVDDDDNICQLVREVAEKNGYVAHIAHSEAELSHIFADKTLNIQVILLDLHLGQADGIELLRLLAKNEYRNKIVLFSGADRRILHTTEQLGTTLGLSMAGILAKPASIKNIASFLLNLNHTDEGISYDKLRQAIDNYELRLHYQPQINLNTNKVIGVEALVRWEPKAHELIFPDAFLPMAESTNLIEPLTFWVIEEAFKQSIAWKQEGYHPHISINVSPKMLNSLSLPDKIMNLAEQYKIDCKKMTFEVTETAVMGQPRVFMDILARMRLKSFSLSIDDFGTGYSSLRELYRLPFNELKIDKSFVMGIEQDEDSRIIVDATIKLAHHLGLTTVIEGVETQAAFDIVHGFGADAAQGYYIAKPMSANDILAWLKHNHTFIAQRI